MAAEYVWETPEEMDLLLAQQIRRIRKRRSVSKEKLSQLSGGSFGSIKRFETTGKISLLSLTKLAFLKNPKTSLPSDIPNSPLIIIVTQSKPFSLQTRTHIFESAPAQFLLQSIPLHNSFS